MTRGELATLPCPYSQALDNFPNATKYLQMSSELAVRTFTLASYLGQLLLLEPPASQKTPEGGNETPNH